MGELGDHDKLIKMETTCELTRKEFKDDLADFKKELKAQRNWMENGLSQKIADSIILHLSKNQSGNNRNPEARTRKRDLSNWSKGAKILTWVIGTPVVGALLVGILRVLGEGFIWMSTFIENIIK